ncbi:MAG: hypothetical protein Q4G65_16680 [bacterium]|nr:hypothetical protein [bacterium]
MISLQQKPSEDGRLARAVTVTDDVFDALKGGQRTFVIKGFDEWNEVKFLKSPVTHLYIGRHTDRRGPTLLFAVSKVGKFASQVRSEWREYIRIDLVPGYESVPARPR